MEMIAKVGTLTLCCPPTSVAATLRFCDAAGSVWTAANGRRRVEGNADVVCEPSAWPAEMLPLLLPLTEQMASSPIRCRFFGWRGTRINAGVVLGRLGRPTLLAQPRGADASVRSGRGHTALARSLAAEGGGGQQSALINSRSLTTLTGSWVPTQGGGVRPVQSGTCRRRGGPSGKGHTLSSRAPRQSIGQLSRHPRSACTVAAHRNGCEQSCKPSTLWWPPLVHHLLLPRQYHA